MNNLFLYNANCLDKNTLVFKDYCVVFFHHPVFDFEDFLKSLDSYFETHSLPERILLLIPQYLKNSFEAIVNQRIDDLIRVIPTSFDKKDKNNFIQEFYYQSNGSILPSATVTSPVSEVFLKQIFNNALVEIFVKREGLIKSETAHHFVFPSGKHCDYFLRPGNILIKGNEIFFIAFNLLSKLTENENIIYCDTSSINSLAFALIELKRRFLGNSFIPPYVESFGSYTAFENTEFTFLKNSIFLVSSSTSSRIIDRLLEKKVDLHQISLIYCIGRKRAYKENIICDLEYNKITNTIGIKPFKSYELASSCNLCKGGSIPVEVTGDVFQIEKPKLNLIEIKVTDAPKFHQEFIKLFFCRTAHRFNFIKSHFYEAINKEALAQPSYELFLDVSGLMENIEKFEIFKRKLDTYITQYIPSKTKFIVHLPDKGSLLLAKYIQNSLSSNVDDVSLINQKDLFQNEAFTSFSENAAVIIVCSTMVSGSRLLYISREMRDYSHLSLVYFIAFTRTENEQYLDFIKSNLTYGKYGLSTHSFVELNRIYTNNERLNTSWIVESDFLIQIKRFCAFRDETKYISAIDFFDKRLSVLDTGYQGNGLSNDLFYENVITGRPLKINKNFAFYRFDDYRDNASQSDVCFTVSVILNSLRNSPDQNRKIINSHFVRTLLEPNNFNRYNDGIIQAAILRAAHSKELNYDLDKSLSFAMLNVIIGIIEFSHEDHGEALTEFLYAIAIKKLRLKEYHIQEMFLRIKSHNQANKNIIINALMQYCEEVTFGKEKELIEDYSLELNFD